MSTANTVPSLRQAMLWPLLLMVFTLLCGTLLTGQAHADPDNYDPGKIAQRKLDALDANDTSTDTKQLRDLYNQAIQLSQDRQEYVDQANGYDQLLKNFAQQTRELQRQIDNFKSTPAPYEYDKNQSQLEQELSIRNADLYNLQNSLTTARNAVSALTSRSVTAREELNQRKAEMDQVNEQITQANRAGAADVLSEATMIMLSAKRNALTAELRMLELELLSVPNRATLAEQKRQLLELQTKDMSTQVDTLQQQISLLRRQDTEKTVEANRKLTDQASDSPPLIKKQLELNQQLSDELSTMTSNIENAQKQADQIDGQSRMLTQRYQDLKKQLDLLKVSVAFGETLRSELRDLPPALPAKQLSDQLDQLQLKIYDYDQQLNQLDNRDVLLEQYQDDPEFQNLSEADRKTFTELLDVRKEILSKLSSSASSYVSVLAQVDLSNNQLQQQLQQFRSLIDEHLLWVPSARPVNFSWVMDCLVAVSALLMPHYWKSVVSSITPDTLSTTAALFMILLMLSLRRVAANRCDEVAAEIQGKLGKVTQDGFLLTLRLILVCAFYTLPWSVIQLTLAWYLHQISDSNLSYALQQALIVLSMLTGLHLLLRKFNRPNNLFIAHFNWPEVQVTLIRRVSRRLFPVALPSIFIIALTENNLGDDLRNTLGRMAFIILTIGLALYYWRVFKDRKVWVGQNPTASQRRLFLAVHWFFPLSQLVLLGLTLQGYYFSAMLMNIKLHLTCFAGFVCICIHSLAIRWLLIEERRLAFSRAKSKRAELLAQRAKEKEANPNSQVSSTEMSIDPPEENLIDLQTVSEQSRKVLNLLIMFGLVVVLWGIWSDLFTSLSFLDQIKLWDSSVTVNGSTELAPISLKAALLSLAVFLLTFVGVRNLPGVLELLILQRIELSPGTGYAITTLTKYILVLVGILVGFSILGFDWSKLQWLVAALGVGLGFGLQEIFANFISGLILLFEKPIRIGDTVTINGLSGTVTKIQIRATTIVDWDRKEIIVPNKTFITQQLVNWSLSDAITRIVVNIGVAYGTDTARAEYLILQAANECDLVLDNPLPEVFFTKFNNSTLDFELRYYVNELGHRLPSQHQILNRINNLFRTNNIEIAFPQMDIHIKRDWPTRIDKDAIGK